MLAFIREKISCWERLRQTKKPIILYGMGNGADKILDWCAANGVRAAGVFASDEFVRGQTFRGFTVRRYDDIIAEFGDDILLVLAFASELPEVLTRFRRLAARHETVAPHLPLFAEENTVSLEWLALHEQELQTVYYKLADEQSRQVFAAALNYKLSGKIEYLLECETNRADDLQQLFTFDNDETYLDLGAYNGDTMQEFLRLSRGNFKNIIAVEPDRRNFKKLQSAAAALPMSKVRLEESGVWDDDGVLYFSDSGGRQSTFIDAAKKAVRVCSIDSLTSGERVTYIKMDVEGAETQAIKGGVRTLRRCQPKMLLAAYHYDADLFRLPTLLWQIVPEYKIYLRKHPYIPAWELNFFAKI